MLGNGVEMSLIFHRILGPLVLGWARNHFVSGAQVALREKRLVCIPDVHGTNVETSSVDNARHS